MNIKKLVVVAAALLFGVTAVRGQSGRKLEISFNEGRVTLVAENVSLAEIFAEWARKGGSQIVNAERLPATPVMPTEFKDQPEADVLRTLLREAPGYGASMRPASGTQSTVQTVFILAVRAFTTTSSPGSPVASPVQQNSPVAAPRLINGSPDDEIPPVRPLTPEVNPGQAPSTPANAPGGAPSNQPTSPNLRVGPGGTVTSTVPGVIIPGPTPTPKPAPGRGGGGGSR